jgi:hypothetical protein
MLQHLLHDFKSSIVVLGGIYSLRCGTCDKIYVGQTGHNLKTEFLEHHGYIKTNNLKSAYTLHILSNRHE